MKRIIVAVSLIVSSALVHAASFDCAKASTSIEKAICLDKQLSVLDSDLMDAYKAAQSNSADPEKIKGEQKTWLQSSRNKCEDVECIRKAYIERITALRPNAIKATEPEPKEVQATTQNKKPTESNPVKNTETPSQHVAQPVETPTPELPKVSDQTPTPQKAESTNEEPSSPIADALFGVAGLIAIALIVGLIKPKWVIRWSDKPSRLKVLGYLIPLLLIVSFTAPMSRTKSRAEHDMKVAAKSKAKAKAETEEKAQRQEQNRLTAQNNVASQNHQVQESANPHMNQFKLVERDFLMKIKAARGSREYNDPNQPSCRSATNIAWNEYTKTVNGISDASKGQIDNNVAAELTNISLDNGAVRLNMVIPTFIEPCNIH